MIESLSHHAYAIAGAAREIIPKVIASFENTLDIRTKGNPDFRSVSYEVMGIEEARALKEAAGRKAVSSNKKIFIVSARGITKEAQNALLKLCEEPPIDTHFFLIVPSIGILLPTLLSRVEILESGLCEALPPTSSVATTFLSEPPPKRLKIIQDLLVSAEKESGKEILIDFLNTLERDLTLQERSSTASALAELLRVKKYSRDRAPSFKLLLEHLALVLPQI